ncbi:lipoprotein (plasmid) [Candidatus Borrelia fainii]|uniref:Lipoprotein n=1 Tax=Candidatus Borrelia fainii TaxID=2518322 RepID=A0ABM8DLP2_9SPIR|nr:P12 family lipoprotein [Candidatus Borrelia fainii]BDU63420.1 lipoprotein [Candidatus Borrelia fainii]BDU63506.1 lipoprotein [Candidatus Borrelia fainii]
MNKSILPLFVLIFLSLFSCDINTLNEMMLKSREKYLKQSNKVEDLNPKDGKQEGELEEGVKHQVVQDFPLAPVNNMNKEIPVPQNFPYYPYQEEIDIKEEDLVPSTKEEKDAQVEIEKVKSVLKDYGFAKLIEDARELKDKYEQLESNFYSTLSALKNKIGSYSKENKTEKRKLIQLFNQLNEERSHVDRLRIQVDNGLYERISAKSFFEKSQDTLKEAITKRLKNSKNWRHRLSYVPAQLSGIARSDAENALTQLESSSSKIGEAMGRKKDIENLIQDAKSYLESL